MSRKFSNAFFLNTGGSERREGQPTASDKDGGGREELTVVCLGQVKEPFLSPPLIRKSGSVGLRSACAAGRKRKE